MMTSERDSITSSQQLTSDEPPENCNTLNQLSPSNSSNVLGSSSQLNRDKYLQPLQNTYDSSKVRHSKNIGVNGDDKIVLTELFFDHVSKTTNEFSKMSADISKQVENNSNKESIYKVVTHVTEIQKIKKTFKRNNSSNGVDDGQSCHTSSSWPGESSKLKKGKYPSDSNLTNVEYGYSRDSSLFKCKDETCSAPTKELLLGETESSQYRKVLGQEMVSESFEMKINCKSLTSMPQVTQSVNPQKSIIEVHVISQCVSNEPVLAQDRANNMLYHTTDESSTSHKMPEIDLNYTAYSEPDMDLLPFNGKSPSVNSLVSFNQILVQQTLSSTSALLPLDLPNQPKVNSVNVTSPMRSNDFQIVSTYSPWSSSAASSQNEDPRSVELFSSPTSVESSSSNIGQQNKHSSPPDKHSIIRLSEESPQNSITRNLPETLCKDFNCNPITNIPHNTLGELTQANTILPLVAASAEITPLRCEFSNGLESLLEDVKFSVTPSVDRTVKITYEAPSISTKGSPTEIHKRSTTPVYEISKRNITEEYVTALNSSVLELCQHQHEKDFSNSDCEYQHQELPRSPLMLINLDGIPYSLQSDYHIVPQYEEECIIHGLENNTTVSDNDHTYCEETKQELLSEAETSHSTDTNSGSLQNYEASQSCPEILLASTKHYQDSTRVRFPILPKLDDNKGSQTKSSNEKTENSPQHSSGKHALSHLSNETSILSFEDTINSEEHRVPDAEPYENVCLSEVSLYSDLPENKQDDLKSKQKTKQVFQWKTVYETQINKPLNEQIAGDFVFEGLSSIQPVSHSHRPRRIGLSRKQKVEHLHNKPR